MTRAEQHLAASAFAHIWCAALATMDTPEAAQTDLLQALRRLITLIPDGPRVLAALAVMAGPQGARLSHLILSQETSHEPERQLRLPLDALG